MNKITINLVILISIKYWYEFIIVNERNDNVLYDLFLPNVLVANSYTGIGEICPKKYV